nr:MAG TPA: hypothetical protein [Caudoviricetes sp.]
MSEFLSSETCFSSFSTFSVKEFRVKSRVKAKTAVIINVTP